MKKLFMSRYKKLKDCVLPYLFYDKKRNVLEWVRYDDLEKTFIIDTNLSHSLEDYIKYNCIYHFNYTISKYDKFGVLKKDKVLSHCHSFEEVINELYKYPMSFELPKEFLNDYSKQEIEYLEKIQDFFKKINLEDINLSDDQIDLNKKINELYKKRHNIFNKIKLKKLYKKYDEYEHIQKVKRYNNHLAKKQIK